MILYVPRVEVLSFVPHVAVQDSERDIVGLARCAVDGQPIEPLVIRLEADGELSFAPIGYAERFRLIVESEDGEIVTWKTWARTSHQVRVAVMQALVPRARAAP